MNWPNFIRRHVLWFITGALCLAKIAGVGIPLWLCLTPALLPYAVVAALLVSAATLTVLIFLAYAVIAIYGYATGKEYVS